MLYLFDRYGQSHLSFLFKNVFSFKSILSPDPPIFLLLKTSAKAQERKDGSTEDPITIL
jgi:hypothetical protein